MHETKKGNRLFQIKISPVNDFWVFKLFKLVMISSLHTPKQIEFTCAILMTFVMCISLQHRNFLDFLMNTVPRLSMHKDELSSSQMILMLQNKQP